MAPVASMLLHFRGRVLQQVSEQCTDLKVPCSNTEQGVNTAKWVLGAACMYVASVNGKLWQSLAWPAGLLLPLVPCFAEHCCSGSLFTPRLGLFELGAAWAAVQVPHCQRHQLLYLGAKPRKSAPPLK